MDHSFGLVGNGRVLAKVMADGTLTEAYFPSIGFYRHIVQSQFGFVDASGEHLWLGDRRLDRRQRYLEDTNVLITSVWRNGLLVEVTDFVHPELDVLVRRAEVRNTSLQPAALRLFHTESASLDENQDDYGHNIAYYDTHNRCLVRFRGHPFDNRIEGHSVLLLAAVPEQSAYQCGVSYEQNGPQTDAFLDVADGCLEGNGYCAGDDRGATTGMMWQMSLAPGEARSFTVLFCGGVALDAAEQLLADTRPLAVERLLADAVAYWKDWLAPAAAWSERIADVSLRGLYRRSLLVNKLMQDRSYGAIIAAPSVSPDYRYCWVRDGAFVAWAFGLAGYHEEGARFFRWCGRAQQADGLWYQNHYTDGRRHWAGVQVDQVGAAIWAMIQHYRRTGDRRFLAETWPAVRAGAEYILSRVDASNGLVYSEQDLWEETAGYLTYTNAACQAGLVAASLAAGEVGVPSTGDAFRQAAERLLASIRQRLVQEGIYVGELAPKRPSRVRTDYVLDISLLGLVVPFEVLEPLSPEVACTVERIEAAADYPAQGVGRYPSDLFMGGNPWPLSALWLALYYLRANRPGDTRRHLEWCLRHVTAHGFIAEQQDKETGAPVSALPLAWAHAWLIALIHALVGRGAQDAPQANRRGEPARGTSRT